MRRFDLGTVGRLVTAWTLLVALLLGAQAWAIVASPYPFEAMQPDGQRVQLHIRGDEHFQWMEDVDGYTVVRHAGAYVYATLDQQGQLEPTSLMVGRVSPAAAGLSTRMLPAPAVRQKSALSELPQALVAPEAPERVGASGTVKNLVIMMRFADHHTRPLPSTADFTKIFNAVGGDPVLAPTGSVKDLFRENSYGALNLDSTVVGWVDLPNTESFYAAGQSGLTTTVQQAIRDALTAADASIDFSQFDKDGDGFVDAIAFIHSGYGAEWGGTDAYGTDYTNRIWSHKWSIPTWTSAEGVKVSAYHISPAVWGTSGTEAGHIGVIAHETGHFFGLPDLYDTDYTSSGIGSYCLMANSWGFTGDQRNPPHLSAWSKIALGWVTPTTISASGAYSAPQVETNPVVFRINSGYPSGEYLLVENRQPVGFESTMPQGGLAIWHIDEAKSGNTEEGYPGQPGWPANNQHYKIALLQADGAYDLEHGVGRGDGGDVYHGNGVSMIGQATVPNSNGYQNGTEIPTGNQISSISLSGTTMTFQLGAGACEYAISPTSQSFAGAGANGSVSVIAPAGCAWTATSNDEWITIDGGAAGAGNGGVQFSVAANATTAPRTGTLSVAGKVFTVTQAGSSPEISLTGRTILIRDRGDDPSKRKLSAVSKDPNLTAAAPGGSSDPTLVGATLHFVNPNSGELDTFSLPASLWSGLGTPAGSKGYRYSDPQLGSGACRSVEIKDRKLKALCQGSQINFSLDEPYQGTVGFKLVSGKTAYCMLFGGTIKKDTSAAGGATGTFKATDAAAPDACPFVPSDSCLGNCGGSAGYCYCDGACEQFGDCCADYAEFCK